MGTTPAFSAAVVEVLKKDNYLDWSVLVKTYLMAHDLWDIVESSIDSPTSGNEVDSKDWSRTNAKALHVIQISCGADIFSHIRGITSARFAWETLAEMCKPKGPDPSSSMASDLLEEGMLDSSIEPVDSSIEPVDSSINPGVSVVGEVITVAVHYLEQLKFLLGEGKLDEAFKFCCSSDFARERVCSARCSRTGKTALHFAAEAGCVKVVDQLVMLMSAENLEIIDNDGFTALARATCKGNRRLAECMVRKSEKLITIQNDKGNIPAVAALYDGNLDLARYLYFHTPSEILRAGTGIIGPTVVCEAIYNNALDIALDLLVHKRSLPSVFAQDRNCDSPFYVLACMPDYFPSENQLVFWKRWIYYGIRVPEGDLLKEIGLNVENLGGNQSNGNNTSGSGLPSLTRLVSNLRTLLVNLKGIKHLYEMKLTHLRSKRLLYHMMYQLSGSSIQEIGIGRVQKAIVRATMEGNFEFVFETVKVVTAFVWSHDAKSRNVFMVAVQYRRAKIFSLIYSLSIKNVLACSLDSTGNNLLHMAGMSAPSTSVDHIAGAALQMQRELQWFQEVESIVPPRVHGQSNKEGLTPRQLFTKNHEDMMSRGEKWMKDTASSCTVVGALIATIMFAAVFTIPGGNDQSKGFPIFLKKKLFLVFIVSDALSLFSSSTSVLMFLGILTSRYAEEDFLESLPRKMIIGLSTLFFSIVAMMTTFSAALLLMLHEESWILKPIICLASIPVTLFVLMQFPLLVTMAISTYGPSVFDRKMKRWF